MSKIIDFFSSIGDTIISLINFVINTISSLIALISKIPAYMMYITESLNVLPSFILPFATAYISLLVIQYICNRRAE